MKKIMCIFLLYSLSTCMAEETEKKYFIDAFTEENIPLLNLNFDDLQLQINKLSLATTGFAIKDDISTIYASDVLTEGRNNLSSYNAQDTFYEIDSEKLSVTGTSAFVGNKMTGNLFMDNCKIGIGISEPAYHLDIDNGTFRIKNGVYDYMTYLNNIFTVNNNFNSGDPNTNAGIIVNQSALIPFYAYTNSSSLWLKYDNNGNLSLSKHSGGQYHSATPSITLITQANSTNASISITGSSTGNTDPTQMTLSADYIDTGILRLSKYLNLYPISAPPYVLTGTGYYYPTKGSMYFDSDDYHIYVATVNKIATDMTGWNKISYDTELLDVIASSYTTNRTSITALEISSGTLLSKTSAEANYLKLSSAAVTYLPINGKAADSDKLDGYDYAAFVDTFTDNQEINGDKTFTANIEMTGHLISGLNYDNSGIASTGTAQTISGAKTFSSVTVFNSVVISTSGNVGLGTANPTAKLSLYGTGTTYSFHTSTATDGSAKNILVMNNGAISLNTVGIPNSKVDLPGDGFNRSMFDYDGYTYVRSHNGLVLNDTHGNVYVGDAAYNPTGSIWISSNCSAFIYTDRTPYPDTLQEAYNSVLSMQKKIGSKGVDHEKLDNFIKVVNKYEVYDIKKDKMKTVTSTERNLSATVSAQNEVIKDLIKRIEILENR